MPNFLHIRFGFCHSLFCIDSKNVPFSHKHNLSTFKHTHTQNERTNGCEEKMKRAHSHIDCELCGSFYITAQCTSFTHSLTHSPAHSTRWQRKNVGFMFFKHFQIIFSLSSGFTFMFHSTCLALVFAFAKMYAVKNSSFFLVVPFFLSFILSYFM